MPLTRARILGAIAHYRGTIIYTGGADLNRDGKPDMLVVANYATGWAASATHPYTGNESTRVVHLYTGNADSTFAIWTEGRKAIPPAKRGTGNQPTRLTSFTVSKGLFAFSWTDDKFFEYRYTFSYSPEAETLVLTKFDVVLDASPQNATQVVKNATLQGPELGRQAIEDFNAGGMTDFYDPAVRGLFGF